MKTLPLLVCLGLATLAHGAGFQLQERSAIGQGRAFAGDGAIADDASVLASNAAALLLVPGDNAVSAGLSGIFPAVGVRGRYTPPGPGAPIPAVADDVSADAAVPYLYLVHRVSQRLALGFGSFTQYGLKTNYPVTFSARGIADHSEIRTVTLNPSAALRLNEWLSIGGGFDALYVDGILDATLPNAAPVLDLRGDDWGYGFNLGLLLETGEGRRIGLHYRSQIDIDVTGRAISAVAPFNGPARLDATLPDSLSLSGYHEFNDRWSIHGDATWTGWSSFDQLAPVVAGAPTQPPVTQERWNNAWRLALGTTWKAGDRLTLRGGLAWDESPVDPAFLTLRIPDSDRFWLSLGMSWRFRTGWSVDLGYTHLFGSAETIADGNAATGTFRGSASGGADIVSLGLHGNF